MQAFQEQFYKMKNEEIQILQAESISLLKKLISIPSFSKQEDNTATVIEEFLLKKKIIVNRLCNNIWVKNKFFDLNSISIPATATPPNYSAPPASLTPSTQPAPTLVVLSLFIILN